MIALVRGVTRFTFAPLQFRPLYLFVVGSALTFTDSKPLRPRIKLRPAAEGTGKDSEGIHVPSEIFTGRKCYMGTR